MSVIKDTKDFLYKIQKKKNAQSGNTDSAIESILEGRKNILNLKILVCIDISGSISTAQFKQFMNQINLIRGLSVVKVVEIDDKVVAVYDYFKTAQNQVVRVQGGGGTEFADAFELAKKMQPDAILFMTDGQVADQVKDPGVPTGWVLTHDGVHPYGFGQVVLTLPPLRGSDV